MEERDAAEGERADLRREEAAASRRTPIDPAASRRHGKQKKPTTQIIYVKIPKTFPNEAYFFTIKTVGWTDVFIRADYREEISKNLAYCQTNKALEIYAFCLMTNHLHMIASAANDSLDSVIRDFKSFTAKKLISMIRDNTQESRRDWLLDRFAYLSKVRANDGNFQFWERDNYPEEIRTDDFFRQKEAYIHQNPVKAGFVGRPEDWLYSSACPECPVRIERLD